MATVGTILRRSLLLLGLLLGLLMVGGLVFVRTEQFRTLAGQHLLDALNTSLVGQFSFERLEGTLWGSLIVHQLRLEHRGETLLHIPRLTARYRLLPLFKKRLEVSAISLVGPFMRIAQDDRGGVQLLEAVSPATRAEPQNSPSFSIGLEHLSIENGQFALSRGDRSCQLNDLRLDARLDITPAGLEVDIRHLSLHALAEGVPRLGIEGAAHYRHGPTPPTVQLHQLRLTTDHSRLGLSGQLSNVDTPEPELDLELSLEKIGLADMLQLAPGLPLKHDMAGQAQLTGRPGDMHATMRLTAAGARFDVQARADLSQQPPRYQGTLRLAEVDLGQLLDTADGTLGAVRGLLHGSLRGRGVGTAVSALEAETSLWAEKLQLAEVELGAVSVQARLADETATLHGELDGTLGKATWQGRLALADGPEYSLSFAADRLALAAAGYDTLSGALQLRGTLQGTGLALPSLNARAEMTLQPSRLGRLNLTHGRLVARMVGGRVHISEATLLTPDARLTLAGELDTALNPSGRLSYSLQIERLSPWLSLVGREGSGRLTLEGTAEGSLGNIRTEGKLRAEAVRLSELSLATAAIDFAATRLGQPQPQASLTIGLSELQAGLALQTLRGEVQLAPGHPKAGQDHRLHLRLTATQTPERQHRLRAHIVAEPERIVAHLQELSVALPLGTWRLTQAARVYYQAGGLRLERIALAKHDRPAQQIILEGRLATTGRQAVQLQVQDVSLEELAGLLPRQPRLRGLFSADVQIAGTAEAPSITGSAAVRNVQIAGQTCQGLSATAHYHDQKAGLQLTFHQDEHHALHATGSLPVSLGWARGFRAAVLGELDASIRSDGLNLASLNAFSGGAADDIAGTLQLDLRASGPADRPLLSGTFGLTDGRATVKPLGLAMSPISLEGRLSPRQLHITQLTATAGKGSLSGVGRIELAEYRPQALDLSFTAEAWPAMWTHRYRVEVDGQLKASGPLTAPRLKGHLGVRQATLRPELSFLSTQPLHHDETIVVRPSAASPRLADTAALQPNPDGMDAETARSPAGLNNFALDLTLDLGHKARLEHQSANITVGGGVTVIKKPDEAPHLAGVIQLAEGWAGFQGRRFVLNRGTISFDKETGLNPRLDILARYTHDDYAIDAVVGGTGEGPTLDLRSTPPLEQADILAVLLFGKPASALDAGEEIDLQQEAVALASGYAAARLRQSVSDVLGLDALGIDLSGLDFSGGHIGFGRALTRKTRVSATHRLGGEQGQEVAIDYEIAPEFDVRTSVNSKGSSSADIIWRKRY